MASYFPFNVACYLIGHSFVAQELTRAEIGFRKADNAFLSVADVDALRTAAQRLNAALVEQRCTSRCVDCPAETPHARNSNSVQAAFPEVDAALDYLSAALGLQPAA